MYFSHSSTDQSGLMPSRLYATILPGAVRDGWRQTWSVSFIGGPVGVGGDILRARQRGVSRSPHSKPRTGAGDNGRPYPTR